MCVYVYRKVLLSCFDRKLLCCLALALMSVGHRISCYFGAILPIIRPFSSAMSQYAISCQNSSSENHTTWDYTVLQLNKGRSRHSWPGRVLLQLSYKDLQMATSILLNHLNIAAVNHALVIRLCKDPTWNIRKSRLCFFARIEFAFALIWLQMERHLMLPGMCLGENFPGREFVGGNARK